MDYPNKTLTKDGAALLAGDDADGNPTIIDKIAVSDKLPNNISELDAIHIQDFSDPIYFPIDVYKHNGATFQAESRFDNSNIPQNINSTNGIISNTKNGKNNQYVLSQDYSIMMIGLMGHEGNVNDADETLIAISAVDFNDAQPYEMPKVSSVPFSFIMAMNLTYSNAQNVKAIISPAGSVTEEDLQNTLSVYLKIDDAKKEYETIQSAEAFQASVANQVAQLNKNVGSDVSNNMKSLEDEVALLRGKPATKPKINARMDLLNGVVNYTITAPEWNGGTDIQEYRVFYSPTDASSWTETDLDGNKTTGQVTNLDPNKHYDFKVIAVNSAGNSPESDTVQTVTGNPPDAPSLVATMDTANHKITFEVTPGNNGSTPINGYQIYYSPDGQNKFTEQDSVNASGEIDNLNAKQKYDVYATATNQAGPSQQSNTVITQIIDSSVYGVQWHRTSDPTLTRTDGAIGLESGINGAKNDFDSVGPWHLIHRVTDSKGNVFVRIPKFYIYKEQDGSENNGNLYVKVSLINHGKGWYLPKCFWNFRTSQELPYLDVGAYDATVGNDCLQSISGKQPTSNVSLNNFRQYARDTGSGCGIMDIHTVDALTCLFIVEFATLDSKSVMEGKDSNNGSNEVNNGVTDNHAGSSGTDTGNRNGTMNYRGIENLWGNLWEWVDGVNLNGGPVWVCDDQSQYSSNVYSYPYYHLNYQTTNGNTSSIGLDPNHPEANFATQNDGSGSNYFCDYSSLDSSGCVPYFGGIYGDGGNNVGLFCWSSDDPSGAGGGIGARLIKKASV